MVDSASVSRTGTMDGSEHSLAESRGRSVALLTMPSRTLALRRAKKPSPLHTQAAVLDMPEVPGTPTSTPTSPSAFRRAFGALFKSIRQ